MAKDGPINYFHIICQRKKLDPKWTFHAKDERTNVAVHTATVTINNKVYGQGSGGSKPDAKTEASRKAIEKLKEEYSDIE